MRKKKKDLRSNLEHPHLNETFNSNEFFKSAKIEKDLEKDVKYLSLFNKNENHCKLGKRRHCIVNFSKQFGL